jgi:dihydrofolate reductase
MADRPANIGMIWAQASNGVIGRDGTMPWHLPEDFAHFRDTTEGHVVIMGRRTWASLPPASRPLPGRRNIVITSREDWSAEGAIRASSLDGALDAARSAGAGQIWIIGGGTVYREAQSLADTAVITHIDMDADGDTFAPVLGENWRLTRIAPETGWSTSRNGTRYRIETWTADSA